LIEEAIKVEGKHRAQIQKEINSMKIVVERWLSVSTEQMVGDPASMETLVNMRTLRKSYTVQKKKKVPISKIPVISVPLPNVKAVRSKIGCRDNVGYKHGGSHVKLDAGYTGKD
jgi:hypothetical protein